MELGEAVPVLRYVKSSGGCLARTGEAGLVLPISAYCPFMKDTEVVWRAGLQNSLPRLCGSKFNMKRRTIVESNKTIKQQTLWVFQSMVSRSSRDYRLLDVFSSQTWLIVMLLLECQDRAPFALKCFPFLSQGFPPVRFSMLTGELFCSAAPKGYQRGGYERVDVRIRLLCWRSAKCAETDQIGPSHRTRA